MRRAHIVCVCVECMSNCIHLHMREYMCRHLFCIICVLSECYVCVCVHVEVCVCVCVCVLCGCYVCLHTLYSCSVCPFMPSGMGPDFCAAMKRRNPKHHR